MCTFSQAAATANCSFVNLALFVNNFAFFLCISSLMFAVPSTHSFLRSLFVGGFVWCVTAASSMLSGPVAMSAVSDWV